MNLRTVHHDLMTSVTSVHVPQMSGGIPCKAALVTVCHSGKCADRGPRAHPSCAVRNQAIATGSSSSSSEFPPCRPQLPFSVGSWLLRRDSGWCDWSLASADSHLHRVLRSLVTRQTQVRAVQERRLFLGAVQWSTTCRAK